MATEIRPEGSEVWRPFTAQMELGVQAASNSVPALSPLDQAITATAPVPKATVGANHNGARPPAPRRISRWLIVSSIAVLGLVALLLYWFVLAPKTQRADFDQTGGTILVFRLSNEPVDFDINAMVQAVEDRLAKAIGEVQHVTVRAGKGNQIEVLVAGTGGPHDVNVDQVRQVMRLGTRLECRILANIHDDIAAMDAATIVIDRARDDADALAEQGLPPPPPRDLNKKPEFFPITVNGRKAVVSYRWVELDTPMRESMFMTREFAKDADVGKYWLLAEQHMGTTFHVPTFAGDKYYSGALFFTRACTNKNLSPRKREAQKFDMFVLVRDEERDVANGDRVFPHVGNEHLSEVREGRSLDDRPALHLTLNAEGQIILGRMTNFNLPTNPDDENPIRRRIGVILDGKVIMGPMISGPLKDRVVIMGDCIQMKLSEMAVALRDGPLPFQLNPVPAQVIRVDAKD